MPRTTLRMKNSPSRDAAVLQDTTLIRVSHMSDEKVARQKTHSR
jgi:hypothetical protein